MLKPLKEADRQQGTTSIDIFVSILFYWVVSQSYAPLTNGIRNKKVFVYIYMLNSSFALFRYF